ncbi:MAG: hypothetical protein R3A12_12815 [Ignavibacteria bacterium]
MIPIFMPISTLLNGLDGNSVYIGNDGGVAYSSDQGATFGTGINYIPVTQYVNFDVGESNRGVISRGSQDNGITGTTNGGQSWSYTKGGDGGGVAVDPHSSLHMFILLQVHIKGISNFRSINLQIRGLRGILITRVLIQLVLGTQK